MSRVRRLIVETHQRSLWQALAVYAGTSLGVLGTVDMFIDNLGLPRWLFWLAFSLLVMGLPVVIAISLAKEEVYGDEVPAKHAEEAAAEDRRLRFLTWRTAGFAFVGAVAMWGVVLTGWVGLTGMGYLLFRGAAADLVETEDCVVVAEFENQTDRSALGLAVREAVVTDIGQSDYVTVLGYNRVRETLGLMRLPDTTRVDQRLAVEIARRDNCPAVVSGTVASLGTGYILSARLAEASTGEELVPLSEIAADDSAVVTAAERLARLVRRHLGESLPSISRSEPLPRITTNSLDALEYYTLGMHRRSRLANQDQEEVIPLFEQAITLDTAFAEAYRTLAAVYGALRDPVASRHYSALAYSFRERLPLHESLSISGFYHMARGRHDSAAYYYGNLLERYGWGRTNLALEYRRMGRFEEALQLHLETFERSGSWASGTNLISEAQILHRHALADSALVVMREKAPDYWENLYEEQRNAYYRGDLLAADSLAREMASDSRATLPIRGRLLLAGLAAMYGHVREALALADSAAQLAFEASDSWCVSDALGFIGYASLAADVPERALPLVDEFRTELTLGRTVPDDEHWFLGRIAFGYALAGELRSAREMLAVMDSLAEANDLHPSGIGEQVLAVIALQEERVENAVDHLRSARAAEFGLHRWEVRRLLAEAYAALGRFPEAIAQYDTISGTYRMPLWDVYISPGLRPLAHERLGSLYLQVGDTVAGARHLSEFIELWKDADLELQPRVEAARRRLAGLVIEGTR